MAGSVDDRAPAVGGGAGKSEHRLDRRAIRRACGRSLPLVACGSACRRRICRRHSSRPPRSRISPARPPGGRGGLRSVRRTRTITAAARTISRTIRRPWSRTVPRPRTSGCTCWRPSPHATSAGSAPSTWWSASRRPSPPSAGSGASAAISQPVRHSIPCFGWTLPMSHRSIAGTWPGTCSRCQTPARQMIDRPLPVRGRAPAGSTTRSP